MIRMDEYSRNRSYGSDMWSDIPDGPIRVICNICGKVQTIDYKRNETSCCEGCGVEFLFLCRTNKEIL